MIMTEPTQNDLLPLLPDELWLNIFQFLDIPELYACSKVNHFFRRLAFDQQLYHTRLTETAKWLDRVYPLRPSCKDLFDRNILLSRVQLAPTPCQKHIQITTRLARIFVKDSLRRGLSRRPTRKELIERGVMKHGGSIFADKIGSLERQRVVDVIKGFFSGSQRPSLEIAIKRGFIKAPSDNETRPVHVLTRMFSYCFRDSTRPRPVNRDAPTRANVYRMTKWFEELARKERTATTTTTTYASPTVATTLTSPTSNQQQHHHEISGISYDGVSALRQRFIAIS